MDSLSLSHVLYIYTIYVYIFGSIYIHNIYFLMVLGLVVGVGVFFNTPGPYLSHLCVSKVVLFFALFLSFSVTKFFY